MNINYKKRENTVSMVKRSGERAAMHCKHNIVCRIMLDGVFPRLGCCTVEMEMCNPVLVMDITQCIKLRVQFLPRSHYTEKARQPYTH